MRFPFPEEGTDNGIGYGGGGLVNERFIVERDDRRDIPRIYLKYLSSVRVVNDDDQYGLGVIAQVAIFVLAPLPVRGRAAASSALSSPATLPFRTPYPAPLFNPYLSRARLSSVSHPRGCAHPLSARYLFAILLRYATLSFSIPPAASPASLAPRIQYPLSPSLFPFISASPSLFPPSPRASAYPRRAYGATHTIAFRSTLILLPTLPSCSPPAFPYPRHTNPASAESYSLASVFFPVDPPR